VMWSNFRVLASLEIGESSRDTVRACQSAKRTFSALIDLFGPLAAGAEPAPLVAAAPQRIAPALLMAYGDDDPDATRPAPLGHDDDVGVDLPVDVEPDEGDTVFDLPLDEPEEGNNDTLRMPL